MQNKLYHVIINTFNAVLFKKFGLYKNDSRSPFIGKPQEQICNK